MVVELLGTPREAQKQPGILPAHTATLAQHSPPLNVLQQQSTSSPTLHLLSIVDASGPASDTRHRAMLSGYLSQRDPAFAGAANINANAITMILPMGRSRDGCNSSRRRFQIGELWSAKRACPQRQELAQTHHNYHAVGNRPNHF